MVCGLAAIRHGPQYAGFDGLCVSQAVCRIAGSVEAVAGNPRYPFCRTAGIARRTRARPQPFADRSEEHTSELQSRRDLVCRLLLEKKKQHTQTYTHNPSRITYW